MPKSKDRTTLLLYVALAFAVGFGSAYFVQAYQPFFGTWMGAGGHMMGGGNPYVYGMMAYMHDYRVSASVNCPNVTQSELQNLGEQLMGQMIGDEKLHEQIDASTPNIDAMHLAMGRMATGCY